jgi:hypothetical protein
VALSRKRIKELNRLRTAAIDLWTEQRDVLDTAGRVARAAGTQALHVGREEVVPRVRDTIDQQVRPAVSSGLSAAAAGMGAARAGAGVAKHKLSHDIIPAVSNSLGSITLLRDVANDPHVRDALARLGQTGSKLTFKAQEIVPVKKSAGPGRYIAVVFGIVGLAVVAYAAWQTLRADDELWVTDDPDETDASSETSATSTS